MGYTHYYYTDEILNQANFNKVLKDFKKILPKIEHLGVKLAGGNGEGKPVLTKDKIIFNGQSDCGHEKRNLGITWPTENAKGVNSTITKVEGQWFAGLKLNTRTCGGDCSHESFALVQKTPKKEIETSEKITRSLGIKDEKIFNFTKTAFKPYDLAVNVCLIIAKHYLKDQIKISSDGEISAWKDAMEICHYFLGYGKDFNFEEGEES